MENINKELFDKYIKPNLKLVTWCVDQYYPASMRATSDRRDDMIQECLIQLLKGIHTYKPENDIKVWIRVIVKRYIFRTMRRLNDRLGMKCTVSELDDIQCDGNDFDDVLTEVDEPHEPITANNVAEEDYLSHCSDEIQKEVNKLTPVQRRLLMGVIQGYSLQEVGQTLYNEGLLDIQTHTANNLILQYWLAINTLKETLK